MTRMDPDDARQGKKGTPVLRVLIAALILCALAAIAISAYGWSLPGQTVPAPAPTAPAVTDGTGPSASPAPSAN